MAFGLSDRISAPRRAWVARTAPGIGLAVIVGLVAVAAQFIEERAVGHAVIEALVIAILLGMGWRTLHGISAQAVPGVAFTTKQVLEFAVVLLGASIDGPALLQAGPALLIAVVIAVAVSITASALLGRLLGLNPKLAILVACGNSICGNSAIAAVAPVIDAEPEDVAASIALTAVLGVVVVLALPLLIPLVGLSLYQYGVLAGLTVYAVPQVLAATFPISAVSGQIGTLVKLVRVLMLGPVVLFFTLSGVRNQASGVRRQESGNGSDHASRITHPFAVRGSRFAVLFRLIPWFITGFIALAVARSIGVLPASLADPLREASRWLTIAAMAALGLSVDVRSLRRVGARVAAAVVGSLALLIALSLLLIRVFGIVG